MADPNLAHVLNDDEDDTNMASHQQLRNQSSTTMRTTGGCKW